MKKKEKKFSRSFFYLPEGKEKTRWKQDFENFFWKNIFIILSNIYCDYAILKDYSYFFEKKNTITTILIILHLFDILKQFK